MNLINFIINYKNKQIQSAQRKEILNLLNSKNAKYYASQLRYSNLGLYFSNLGHAKILEAGCGPGKYVALLAALNFEVVGIDLHYFSEWKLIKKKYNVKLMSNINVENLPFDDNTFDHAVCLGALLYFDNPIKAIKEIKRVVKPKGHIIIRTVNRLNFYTKCTGKKLDPFSKNLYSPLELKNFLESLELKVLETFTYGFWPPILTNFWWYLQSVWIPEKLIDILSWLTPEKNRINIIVDSINLKKF